MGKAKGKAKIASKNNPEGRGQAKVYMVGGKKIKPVKIVTSSRSFFGAEFDGGGLVCDATGNPMVWAIAKIQG